MGFGKDGKGVIIREARSQAIGTLAAQTGLIIGTKLATLERFRIIKYELWATITGVTAGEMNGMVIGLTDGTFTLAQIEASIEANGPLGPNEPQDEETSERFIKLLGAVAHSEVQTEVVFTNEKGGPMMGTTVRWTFSRTKSWNLFVYNMGVPPTTGATVLIRAKAFGVWVT